MKPNIRACVAYVAIRLISGCAASSVYDHARSRSIRIDGAVGPTNVDVYDYDRGAHFGGGGFNGAFELYDHGAAHHVELRIEGKTFEGYDYGEACPFSGDVNDTTASLYDFAKVSHFDYSV